MKAFDRTIAPILAAHCLKCHGGTKPAGGLNLSRRAAAFRGGDNGPAIVASALGKSLLWTKIKADDMPPKHPLPAAAKQKIRQWIVRGAKWGTDPIDPFRYTSNRRAGYDWWSLQPLMKHAVPQIAGDRWSRTAIDRFILARLRTQKLTPSPRADPRKLVRRVYIDLIGLPPPAEVIDEFEKAPSPAAWERLVDRLLSSRHYGERWARHWLDVAPVWRKQRIRIQHASSLVVVLSRLGDSHAQRRFALRSIRTDATRGRSSPGPIRSQALLPSGFSSRAHTIPFSATAPR